MNRSSITRRIVTVATAVLVGLSLTLAPLATMADTVPTDGVQQQITDLSGDMGKKKAQLQDLGKKADAYKSVIDQKKVESASLQDDIAMFDNRIGQMELDIGITKDQASQLQLEMSVIDDKMKLQGDRVTKERQILAVLARTLYRVQFRRSVLDILLANKSLSEFFDSMRQIADLQAGVTKSLHTVNALKVSLEQEKQVRESKSLALGDKERELDVAKREIEDERSLKQTVLDETQSSELEYRYMLAELKRQQDDADSEINYLEKTMREKADLVSRLRGQDSVLAWPVVPARGISTKFHDPDYPFRYVFEHPGIDIPTPQGSPVRAAAAGVVARAKDGGMGYSYVMLIHNGDVSTVYGHLSKITAKEDSFVERGEIIGYSGGLPGTPGAGNLTTGPHLHFESRLHGIPTNPMQFLVSVSDEMAIR